MYVYLFRNTNDCFGNKQKKKKPKPNVLVSKFTPVKLCMCKYCENVRMEISKLMKKTVSAHICTSRADERYRKSF